MSHIKACAGIIQLCVGVSSFTVRSFSFKQSIDFWNLEERINHLLKHLRTMNSRPMKNVYTEL